MEHYSILDPGLSPVTPQTPPPKNDMPEAAVPAPEAPREQMRFPGEDGGRSLAEMALRDLNAALQLLAERAQYITGASGAAIALREGKEMICRATAGSSAPGLGTHLQVDSGLSGESVRLRQIMRCNDVETDSRVNRESCRALGIGSVMVMPLVWEAEVNGIFELFSATANAFEERDVAALERLAEMIQTAVEHAEAAQRAQKQIAGEKDATQPSQGQAKVEAKVAPRARPVPPVPAALAEVLPDPIDATEGSAAEQSEPPLLLRERGNIGQCQTCGFPVSEGRVLCLDCEKSLPPDKRPIAVPVVSEVPEFRSQLALPEEESWLQSHMYMIGTLLVVAIAIVVLLWR
jgi:putative methionine-R-sulfoxide reductase with GAF domain